VSLFKTGPGLLQIKTARRIQKSFGFLLPDAHHLRRLFLERHPVEQILHPFLCGQSGVLVWGLHERGTFRSFQEDRCCFMVSYLIKAFATARESVQPSVQSSRSP